VSDIASPDHRTSGEYLRARDQLDFESDPGDIYIGDKLARTLDVELEDRVVLTVSPVGASRPASAAFRLRGVFHTGVDDLDGFYVQISLTDAQQLLSLNGSVTQVALLLSDLRDTTRVATELQAALATHGDLEILRWQEALRELYEAIVLDDIGNYLMHAIVFLIVSIGIFNTILMSVIERTREFGVMIAIGTSGRRMFATVMAEATVLALVACALGLAIGLSLHYWMATTGLDVGAIYGEDFEFAGIAFKGRIYSKLYAAQVATWTAIVFGIVIASSLYPALRATRLNPAKAMRHA
jgi:ABC-type lipoprotein release transport system permease subunit